MPLNDPDPTDPNMLVGVMLPADADATRDMAYVFAEEFARMGHDKQQILALFKNPYYAGAHGAYRALGEKETLAIIDECVAVWGIKITVQDVPAVQTDQPPTSIHRGSGLTFLPRAAGDDEERGWNDLNVLKDLNPPREERDDA